MGKSIAGQTGGGVSNAGKGGDPQATLAGHDSFRDGTHAHGIGTEFSVSSNFGRSFVIGTAHGAIYSGVEFGFGFAGRRLQGFGEGGGIGLGEIHKPFQAGLYSAAQRIVAHEIQVIFEGHEIAGLEFAIDSSSGVGKQNGFNAVFCEHPNGHGNRRHRMAFIIMRPTLEDNNFGPGQMADQGLADMAGNTGSGETGQFCVGHGGCKSGLFCSCMEAAAQHDGELGAQCSGAS